MSYSVGKHFEDVIKHQVETGRYKNQSEVVRAGLRLIEEQEIKLVNLREHIQSAIDLGGNHTDDEIEEFLKLDES